MNLLTNDEITLKRKGISLHQIEEQLNCFKTGFPFLIIKNAASIGNGIIKPSDDDKNNYLNTWENYLKTEASVLKFVPASGAASRMFKDLFEFLEKENNVPSSDFEKKFFTDIEKFAFYIDLNSVCIKNNGKNIPELIKNSCYKEIIENLTTEEIKLLWCLPLKSYIDTITLGSYIHA